MSPSLTSGKAKALACLLTFILAGCLLVVSATSRTSCVLVLVLALVGTLFGLDSLHSANPVFRKVLLAILLAFAVWFSLLLLLSAK